MQQGEAPIVRSYRMKKKVFFSNFIRFSAFLEKLLERFVPDLQRKALTTARRTVRSGPSRWSQATENLPQHLVKIIPR